MSLKCEGFVKNALPATRSLLARKMMKERGMTQMQVASVLGVSQASISQYLSAKRGSALVRKLSTDSRVMSSLEVLLGKLLDRKLSKREKQLAYCDFCIIITRRLFGGRSEGCK